MSDQATIFYVQGWIDNEVNQPNRDKLAEIKAQYAEKGMELKIVGDGTYVPTLDEIRQEIAQHDGPVEVILDAHGGTIPAGSEKPMAGEYVVTVARSAEAAEAGEFYAPVQDFFDAMPENVKGVFLGTCGSEAALKHADHLPEGTPLYISSRSDDYTVGGGPYGADAISMLSNVPQGTSLSDNGVGLDSAYRTYLSTFRNNIKLKDGEIQNRETPDKFAISGAGTFDLSDIQRDLVGYSVDKEGIRNMVNSSSYAQDHETAEYVTNAFTEFMQRISNGEALDDKLAPGIIIIEANRRAVQDGLTVPDAIERMRTEAEANRNALTEQQSISKETQTSEASVPETDPKLAQLASLGANLRASMPDIATLAAMQPGKTDHRNVVVPAAAQAQGEKKEVQTMVTV